MFFVFSAFFAVQTSPLLGFLAGHNRPTDGLGVFEDPGLHGFVFSGCGHTIFDSQLQLRLP